MMTGKAIVLGLLWGFASAAIFSLIYAFFYKAIPGKGVKKGMLYGFIIWLIGPVVGVVGMPLYMTIAPTVIVYWVANFFVSYLIMGAIVGVIYKEKLYK